MLFMAEIKKTPLEIPSAVYDYVLYYECDVDDWINKSKPQVSEISGNGNLLNLINWSSTKVYTDKNGRVTRFGLNEDGWDDYVKNHKPPTGVTVKNFGKDIYCGIVEEVFWKGSCAHLCANYACAILLFQIKWQGFSPTQDLYNELKNKCGNSNYNFIKTGTYYQKIADATHAYSDPMVAYDTMIKYVYKYYYNLSASEKYKDVRKGWMRRFIMAFTPHGLCVETGFCNNTMKYESSIQEWIDYSLQQLNKNNQYKVILSWNATPEQIAAMSSNIPSYTPSSYNYNNSTNSSTDNNNYGSVYQMGNYSNAPNVQIISQQNQSRDDVWNTLIGGSYMQDKVIKCAEFITTDKIKNVKM